MLLLISILTVIVTTISEYCIQYYYDSRMKSYQIALTPHVNESIATIAGGEYWFLASFPKDKNEDILVKREGAINRLKFQVWDGFEIMSVKAMSQGSYGERIESNFLKVNLKPNHAYRITCELSGDVEFLKASGVQLSLEPSYEMMRARNFHMMNFAIAFMISFCMGIFSSSILLLRLVRR